VKTALYKLVDKAGNLLKWGISIDPHKRYPKSFMKDKKIVEVLWGRRAEVKAIERVLEMQMPGPLNRVRWRGIHMPR
jgi:hypothetical protein